MVIDAMAIAGAKFGEKIIHSWLEPSIQNLRKSFDIKVDSLAHSFADYLDRTHTKHSYLQTIVFPNQQVLLKDLYIPLEIISNGNPQKRFLLDCYLNGFLPFYKKVLIVDTAGMGKSTLLKFLFLRAVERNVGIPILIELRKLSKDKTILDYVCSELSSIKGQIKPDLIASLIEKGNFIFFFDGYDEIPSEHRESVTQDLEEFRVKADKNLFLLSSREEQGLASFSEFQRFNIRPLTEDEAYALIKKYDRKDEIYDVLINKLQESEYAQVKDFLTNPLLVSLLYKSFEFKPTVPLKRPIFYRQVYESLFENHDFSKGGEYQRRKKSSLDIDQFHSMLRALGFVTYKEGKTEFGSEEFLQLIDKAKAYCIGLNFSNSDFRNDLINQVPLIINDGNFYRWSHKSIQEYFAACYICMDSKENESEILRSVYKSERIDVYMSMFTLCYDIDYKKFSHVVILELAKEFINFYESSYNNIKHVGKEYLNARKELLAFKYSAIFNTAIITNGDEVKQDDPFIEAHQTFTEEILEKTGFHIGSTRMKIRGNSSFIFAPHRLDNLISYLANKAEVDFIINISSTITPPLPIELSKKIAYVYLDDSVDSVANKVKYFHIINQNLEYECKWRFDYLKAKDTVAKIESEIATEAKADFSF